MPAPNRRLLVALLLLAAVAPLRAERLALSYREATGGNLTAPRGSSASPCASGEVHDDGIPENGFGWANTVADGRLVDRFTPSSYPYRYGQLSLCWLRLPAGNDDTVAYEVVAYDDDGPGGTPGTLLGSVPAVATGVPTTLPGAFFTVDLSSIGVQLASGSVYLGARWNAVAEQGFFLCGDESATTPANGGQAWSGPGPWAGTNTVFPSYRALLVQATAAEAIIEVPTLDRVGLVALLALLAGSAVVLLRRRASA